MEFEETLHWKKQKRYRLEITNDLIEFCIRNSKRIKDRIWSDAFNSICKIPASGRTLKVVYKDKGKVIKIITAYWID